LVKEKGELIQIAKNDYQIHEDEEEFEEDEEE
jgi:hypothetical protein